MSNQINKYLKNAYKVYSGQKAYQVVANLSDDLAKTTNFPKSVVVKKAFFGKMAESHPEIGRDKLFNFVKTLNIPDEVYQISKENRLNFFRNLKNKTLNIVSTGKDWKQPQQNVITSFNAIDPKEMKYVNKIKNTSNKVFPINSGGAGNSSSDMLSQVPGVGARLPRSSESTNIIPQNRDCLIKKKNK